jgi:hypothetical protein
MAVQWELCYVFLKHALMMGSGHTETEEADFDSSSCFTNSPMPSLPPALC